MGGNHWLTTPDTRIRTPEDVRSINLKHAALKPLTLKWLIARAAATARNTRSAPAAAVAEAAAAQSNPIDYAPQ